MGTITFADCHYRRGPRLICDQQSENPSQNIAELVTALQLLFTGWILLPILGAGALVLGGRRLLVNLNTTTDKPVSVDDSKITVIIPSLGGGERLKACMASLAIHLPQSVTRVIVILQQPATGEIRELRDRWQHSAELLILQLEGRSNKTSAIRTGMAHADSEFILLTDSDICVSANIDRILALSREHDAVFGMLLPKESPNQNLLERIVKSDKVVSHAVWRWGRFALNLWPNIPGQCYLIRASVLRRVYDGGMGHLDDLSLTIYLAALQARVAMIPVVVGFEEGRSTWMGLLSQRIRWSVGLLQSFRNVFRIKNGRTRGATCWALHAWLYYGWPLTTIIFSTFLLCQHHAALAWWCCFVFISCWTTLVWCGNRVFASIDGSFTKSHIVYSGIPAALIIAMSQTVGFLLAPLFVFLEGARPFLTNQLLYKR